MTTIIDEYEIAFKRRISGLKNPYAGLAADIVYNAVVDYYQPGHTRTHVEARDWLLTSELCQFIVESLGGDYEDLKRKLIREREQFFNLRRRDPSAARVWWRSRFLGNRMPRPPLKRSPRVTSISEWDKKPYRLRRYKEYEETNEKQVG